jgi:glycosyltransferase involved in cell wall biosynthesis
MSRNLKVLYVIDTLEIGGAESVCLDIFQNGLKYGIKSSLLVIQNIQKTEYDLIDNGNIKYLNRASKWNIVSIFKAAFYLFNFRIIHTHLNHTFRYIKFIKILFFPFLFRNKIILHDHSFVDNSEIKKHFHRTIFIPSFYITVTQEKADSGVLNFGLNHQKTLVLNNLLPDLEIIKKPSSLCPIEVFKDDLVIVGNVKPVKNHMFAITLAAELNLKLDVIGKIQDQQYFGQLTPFSNSKVNFRTDINDVISNLPKYKLGLFTSFNESGPLVLLEYLVSGIPFISTKVGSIGQILYNYYPDFFIENYKISEWKDRVLYLLESDYVVDQDKVNHIFNKHFNRDAYFKKLVEIYKSF